MGVEPFLIAATVIGVLAQRLSRRVCSNCKEAYQAKASDLRRFGFVSENPDEPITLYRGKGCDTCRGSGYKGRLGIYELMVMNQEIAELVVRRATLGDIKAAAIANGMEDMKSDGLYKILRGDTTPDEVMRVVFTAGF
jgi:type IV pilus assembly protein PilB